MNDESEKTAMHILIVDDEPLARKRLVRMVESLEGYAVIAEASNGQEALTAVNHYDPDIVLLDIQMPGENGIEVARTLAALDEPPAIIFCTAHNEYAVQAFETLAVGYLMKPIEAESLTASLEKASRVNKVQRSSLLVGSDGAAEKSVRQHISAKTHSGINLIALDTVYCFVADQKYVSVIHEQGETLIDETLKELEQEFSAHFLRVHRNSLIAIREVDGMSRDSDGHCWLILKHCDYRASISRRHMPKVRQLLNTL